MSYIMPLRAFSAQTGTDLARYLQWLAARAEVIVVDGSDDAIFAAHGTAWGAHVVHVRPDPERVTPMGKVGGVLTGLRLASHERVVIADDDVRYDDASLIGVVRALDDADVVRPQNYFVPMPWHAHWDTGRTLLNRVLGGDWPGTLAVRRTMLQRTAGYDGEAMFENLELVRTVLAAGGREVVLLSTFVARRPSTVRHFLSQRVRQAYDEFARPSRLVAQLSVLPLLTALVFLKGWVVMGVGVLAIVAAAEVGRRRACGRTVFPMVASWLAPAWLAERALCSWLAVLSRLVLGGIPYRGRILRHAATPMAVLRARHLPARTPTLPRAPRTRSA
ncbi:MAG: hypothetical protein NVS4B3_18160 [Gemmatimonadaceae bacterium]